MEDVRVVDPAKERIRKAVLYFREEGTRLAERTLKLMREQDALLVVRARSRWDLACDASLITIREAIAETWSESQLCKRRQAALPAACSSCDASGVVGSGPDARACSSCGGAGFQEPLQKS